MSRPSAPVDSRFNQVDRYARFVQEQIGRARLGMKFPTTTRG